MGADRRLRPLFKSTTQTVKVNRRALRNAVRVRAGTTTGLRSYNRTGLISDKKAAEAFFCFAGKTPEQVDVLDIESCRDQMQRQGLKPNTVYARISRLASFFEWLRRDPELGKYILSNPARPAMPKRPKPYQTESTNDLLLQRSAPAGGHLVARLRRGD